MHIIIKKNIIDEIIEIVSKFTDPISSFYGMRCILINTDDNKITFKATNEITNIIKSIDVDNTDVIVKKPGEILIQANIFKNIIKKLNGFIEIEKISNSNLIEIKQDSSRYTLNTSDVKTFPKIDESTNTKEIEINTDNFKKAVKNVAFAASNENNLIYKCINFRSNGNKLNLTATDSYRLAFYTINTNYVLDDFEFSVNAKDVKDLIPSDAPKVVKLFYNSIKVGIKYDNTVITSRITDLPYHDIESLFTKVMSETKYKVTINKNELNNLLNKIWIGTNDKQNRIEIKIKKNELSIFTKLDEIGDSFVKTENLELEGSNLEFDINYNYLKEALSVFDDELYILVDEKIQKILIISKSNPNTKQLISPMRR
ncbi:DNA polymerase III, beta subunit [Mycoplasmopsis maculosa]|uniref:DNA polymerase III, beta subunit n=1 Tax=Mycoplasmopsis maculosa TaxID=114885 RepID=A0A449B4T7_9BACT|nr:DNA polymerase III subunit beta [Mycoplasmopsis maculosa]VEU75621.1 DNA polymerase III, beta subunit [Mycoplasmopsis maculosa]